MNFKKDLNSLANDIFSKDYVVPVRKVDQKIKSSNLQESKKIENDFDLNLELDEDFDLDIESIEPEEKVVQLFDGYLGEKNFAPNPLEYGPNAMYRQNGTVYRKSVDNLWEVYLKDGSPGARGAAGGSGTGVQEVQKIATEIVTSAVELNNINLTNEIDQVYLNVNNDLSYNSFEYFGGSVSALDNSEFLLNAMKNKRTIIFKEGVYTFNKQVFLSAGISGCNLIGAGKNKTIFKFINSRNGIVFSNNSFEDILISNITFENTTIFSAHDGNTYGLITPSVATSNIKNLYIENCTFTCPQNTGNGIKGVFAPGSRLDGCFIRNCEFVNISRAGIEFWPPANTNNYFVNRVVIENNIFDGIGVKLTNSAVSESLAVSIVTSAGLVEINGNRFSDIRVDAGGVQGTAIEASGRVNIHNNTFDQTKTRFTSILVANNHKGVDIYNNIDIWSGYGGFNWKIFDAIGPVKIRNNNIRGTVYIRGGKNVSFLDNTLDTLNIGSTPIINLELERNIFAQETSRSTCISTSVSGNNNTRVMFNKFYTTSAVFSNSATFTNLKYSNNIVNDVYID